MPDIGNTSIGASTTLNLSREYRGLLITMSVNGTAESITGYIEDDDGSTANFMGFIYNSGATSKLDETACRSNISATPSWQTLTGLTYSLVDTVTYLIGIAADNGSTGVAYVNYDSVTNAGRTSDYWVPSSYPCSSLDSDISAGLLTDNYWPSIYLTYTTGGGATSKLVVLSRHRGR